MATTSMHPDRQRRFEKVVMIGVPILGGAVAVALVWLASEATPANSSYDRGVIVPAAQPVEVSPVEPVPSPLPAPDVRVTAPVAEAGKPGMGKSEAQRSEVRVGDERAARTVEVQHAVRLTSPTAVKLSRADMLLLRHYQLEKTAMQVRLCVTEAGQPTSVVITRGSGADEVDAHVVEQLYQWLYLPTLVDGKAVSSCTDVTVVYEVED